MFEIIIIGIAIAIIVGLFKLIKAVVTSNAVKILLKLILRLVIAVAISLAIGFIFAMFDFDEDFYFGMTLITFVSVILVMVIRAIIMKKKKESINKAINDEINGFKQALLKTRQVM